MSGADRMRRRRQREREGLRIAPVPYNDVDVPELLTAAGYLKPDHYDDPAEIGRILGELLPGLLLQAVGRLR